MNNWIKSILIGLAAALICFVLLSVSKKNNNKQAYEMHYQVEVVKEQESLAEMDEIMNQTMHIIERRLDQLGYSSTISREDINHLNIIINNDTDIPLTTQMVSSNNKLEFREVYMLSELANSFSQMSATAQKFFSNAGGNDSNKITRIKNIGSLIGFSVDADGRLVDKGTIGAVLRRDTALINKILTDPEVLNSFPQDVEFLYGHINSAGAKDKENLLNMYAIKTRMHKALLQNKDIVSAEAADGFNGHPEVRLQFSSAGSRVWERMTAENKGRYIAIIIDKKVISAPHVNEAISGGISSISGGFDRKEVELLARQLNAGSVPADFYITEMHKSPEKPSPARQNWLIPLMVFFVASGLSILIFYSLKRN